MPELPEVENVRRTLAERLAGRRVVHVEARRADVVVGDASPVALLAGDAVDRLERHGKQLAVVGASDRAVCIHLGMTGQLRAMVGDDPRTSEPHTHVVWRLDNGWAVTFRDARRFGGVWTYPSRDELVRSRWQELGEDALLISAAALHAALSGTRRPLKAALLDQGLVAGLGNIYVDELLHAGGWSPLRPADTLGPAEARRMVRLMRGLLTRAIEAGGSTLRDYVNGDGAAGGFQNRHRVYGRGGQPCRRCKRTLEVAVLAGRTTVYCLGCQGTGPKALLEKKERTLSSSS